MTLNSLPELTAMIGALPEEIQRDQLAAVRKSALMVTRSIRNEIRIATGGDNRLSGVGRRGVRVGARYDVKGTVNPTALIRATGPLHLIERDTDPHAIPRVRKRRRKKKKVLQFANGDFAASAYHPGTKGQWPFRKGWERSRYKIGPIFDAELRRSLRRVVS